MTENVNIGREVKNVNNSFGRVYGDGGDVTVEAGPAVAAKVKTKPTDEELAAVAAVMAAASDEPVEVKKTKSKAKSKAKKSEDK